MTPETRDPVRVTFEPEGRSVFVMPGTLLVEAAGRAGIVLDTPCGGNGTCGKCRVEVALNPPEPTEAERRHFSPAELARGMRLACQTRVSAELRVVVPIAARFFDHKILTDGRGRKVPLHPTVSKYHVKIAPPSLEDQRSDSDRLHEKLKEKRVEPNLDVLRKLPVMLRENDFEITAVTEEGRLIAIEPGDTSRCNYGIAFDIGTTTVVGFLLDLTAGREIAVGARTNPQIAFGDDVVNRINRAANDPNDLKKLQSIIVQCLNEIIGECCKKARIRRGQIYEATVVGNTTMNHLFLGINPAFIAQAPYVAALRRPVNARAREVGLRIHPSGLVHTLPNIAGFVGADTVGVILSAGMHEAEEMMLAVDIGTNGELVLGNRDRLVTCSTAAGPAFEGARIRFGMRAAEGAVDRVLVNDDLAYNVIGNCPPRGICGTGLIDLVAELLRVGCIDPTGRLLPIEDLPPSVPDAVKRRVVKGEGGMDFIIATADQTELDEPIRLTQRDIREFQLAKGAISAGIAILMKELGVQPADLGHILLAGAFGNFIRRKMARRVGLLPDVPSERIFYIGNAAGAGARMALLSRRCKTTANRISERAEYLELAGRADFQDEFMSGMMFPEA